MEGSRLPFTKIGGVPIRWFLNLVLVFFCFTFITRCKGATSWFILLAINRLRVLIRVTLLPDSNSGKVVYTRVPLSPSGMIWYEWKKPCTFWKICGPLSSGQLSLLPFVGQEMSSSLWATGWRPSVADWGVCLLAANRGSKSNCSLTRIMDGRIVRCSTISSLQSAATFEIVKALLATS